MDWIITGSNAWITPEVLDIIGIVGFLSYICGFAALQAGLICGNGLVYTLTKLIGASFVLISLISAFNLASMLIQVSYIAIALVGLCRHFRPKADASASMISRGPHGPRSISVMRNRPLRFSAQGPAAHLH